MSQIIIDYPMIKRVQERLKKSGHDFQLRYGKDLAYTVKIYYKRIDLKLSFTYRTIVEVDKQLDRIGL